jgi:glycine oxidase
MKDYIIVGQGIAGSVMAMQLLMKKKDIVIIDEPSLSSCSKVAAGLYNPVVFKRLTRSWNIDTLLPAAADFYREVEKITGKKFFHSKHIVKFFTEEQEKSLWEKKSGEKENKYLSTEINNENISGTKHIGYHSEVNHSGYLDVNLFMDSAREVLKNNCVKEKFDHSALELTAYGVRYKNIEARNIIFCEGYRAIDNPYFPTSAFKLTKGELLIVRIENLPEEKVINKGVFILPIGNHIFKVGATYEWNEINEMPSAKGKQELVEKLEKIISVPYEILEHKAGIRPTTIDRRPVVGSHPVYKQIAFLNGMGTKGVLYAPYYAGVLIEHIETESGIDKEVDVGRFY